MGCFFSKISQSSAEYSNFSVFFWLNREFTVEIGLLQTAHFISCDPVFDRLDYDNRYHSFLGDLRVSKIDFVRCNMIEEG
jgi:hypothetical protein